MDPVFKRGRRLFTLRISCPRPPTLRSTRQGRNSLQFVASYLKDTSQHLFCAIGVAVGEVQQSPLSLHLDYVPRPQACTGPTRRLIEAQRLFAILPLIPLAFKRGQRLFEGGIYSRKYGTLYIVHVHTCT